MFIRTKLIFSIVLALLLAACGGTDSTAAPKKQVSIENFGWIIKNDDLSQNADGVTARLWSSVDFADTGLEATDFASIRIISPTGMSWTIDDASDFENWYDSEESWYPIGNIYSTKLDGGSYVALGNYTVEVTLKNGNKAKKTLFVPAPGSASTDGYEFAYTEDYSGAANPPSNYVALPKRATITNATLDLQEESVKVAFSVDDSTIYSGWLWFYDEAGDWIGYSELLRDYETGSVLAQLNGNATLLTDGSTNTLTLGISPEQLTLEEDALLSDIASVSVILTDGEQYVGKEANSYDARSRTGKLNVAVTE